MLIIWDHNGVFNDQIGLVVTTTNSLLVTAKFGQQTTNGHRRTSTTFFCLQKIFDSIGDH